MIGKWLLIPETRAELPTVEVAISHPLSFVARCTIHRGGIGRGDGVVRVFVRVADLRYVVDRLSEFYTPDEIRLWLHSHHQLLNRERSVDLIKAARTEEVLTIIERLDAGAHL